MTTDNHAAARPADDETIRAAALRAGIPAAVFDQLCAPGGLVLRDDAVRVSLRLEVDTTCGVLCPVHGGEQGMVPYGM